MKPYLPKNAEDASALIITLLVVLLLTTIAVSFLSTARLEQTATRNYSAKTMAEQFAISATEQAMAKIEQGFNATGNGTGNFTSILTTQPGAIKKYFFSNGTLQTNRTITTELFTSGSGNLTNLNNFQNPGNSTSNATSNQWTITGNASERINVFMENVTTTVNGTNQTVGRIAYYVDDEGAKLNLNAATGNRSTLNVGARPQDIAALIGGNQSANFNNTINGTGSNSTSEQDKQKDIKHWSHFFRPEQVSAAVAGFSGNNTPFLSTVTTSASSTANMTHLLTPWGTQRIPINTLSTNATDGTGDASVRSIFESLTGLNATSVNGTYTASNSTYGITGRGLQNIFGGNFSTKYTALGVKQIAANMLQMRDPNTFSVNASGNYSGALIGANNLDADGIPTEYLGYAPYPVISEVGFSCLVGYQLSGILRVTIYPTIELYNPYPFDFIFKSGYPRIMVAFRNFSFDINYTYNGTTSNKTINNTTTPSTPFRKASFPGAWNPPILDSRLSYDALNEFLPRNTEGFIYIPAKTKVQTYFLPTTGWGIHYETYLDGAITINSLSSNASIDIKYAKLISNSNNGTNNIYAGNENTIRDWVTGNETGWIPVNMRSNFTSLPVTTGGSNLGAPTAAPYAYPFSNPRPPGQVNVPTSSASRISFFNNYPVAVVNGTETNWYTGNGITTWSTNSSTRFGNQGNTTQENPNNSNSLPSLLSAQTTPADPSLNNSVANAVYASNNASDMREPFLVTGNYTCPADLGLVPTNKRWRRLRMQMQPRQEVSTTYGGPGNQTFIPDWAMLDVISFGNSTNANDPFTRQHPVNINGRFYLPGNASITPRTMGLQALTKVLENSNAGTIQDPMNPANSPPTDTMRFRGNTINATMVVNNIRNMSWSTSSTWGNRRSNKNFPADQYILPSEIMEIAGVADAVSQTDYNNSISHFKRNEGRASALIPAVTTRSNFFTIYAYAQALDKQGNIDSEVLTKTLLEVQYNSGNYSVKKLYTQPISVE